MGWFKGKIVAYNKRQGYFVEYEEKEEDRKTIPQWSDWLEDLDTNDVKIMETCTHTVKCHDIAYF